MTRYLRELDGKFFVFHSGGYEGAKEKAYAQRVAQQLRDGKIRGGCGFDGKHFARVVSMDYHPWPKGILRDAFGKWAVYSFPNESRERI